MGNFGKKLERFWEIFYEYDGYQRVLTGLQNTVYIAVVGLAIGIIIGTVIAIVEVLPKYKRLPRILNGFAGHMWVCSGEHQWLFSYWWPIMWRYPFLV